MKNLVSFLLLILPGILHAQDVSFFDGTWEEVNAKAKAEHKMIMVDAYTVWCGPCKMMDKMYFHGNPETADLINQHFIGYKVECEHDFGIVFSRKFKIAGYPSVLFFNSDGQLMDRMLGFDEDQEKFLAAIQKVIDMDPKETYRYDAHQLDMPWPDFYMQAYKDADNSNWKYPKDADPNAWLDTQDDLLAEIPWAVMSKFNLNDTYNAYFIEHYAEYLKLYKAEASTKLDNVLYGMVVRAVSNDDPALYEKAVEMTQKYLSDQPFSVFYLQQFYFSRTGKWDEYARNYDRMFHTDDFPGGLGIVNDVGWTLYENTQDQELLTMALHWFDPYMENLNDYAAMDTYAALLFATRHLEEAKTWAQRAIEQGKIEKADVSGTEELLENIVGEMNK